jgi:hypothetical protein
MAIINPEGFFNGDRLRRCSNAAQLHWPRLFLASDGFARLEINYPRIVGRAYATFNPIPTEQELLVFIREYAENFLLFLYQVGGQMWGVWDTKSEFLPRYKTAQDRRSPIPPEPAFTEWRRGYREETKSFPKCFEGLPKVSETFPCGVGVGGGVGVVKIPCSSADERSPEIALELTAEASEKNLDEWFDLEFWPAYPRRVAKPKALAAARRHGKTATDRAVILACLRRRLPSLQAQNRADGNFIPYPASWLNQMPWTEPEETGGPAKPTEMKAFNPDVLYDLPEELRLKRDGE